MLLDSWLATPQFKSPTVSFKCCLILDPVLYSLMDVIRPWILSKVVVCAVLSLLSEMRPLIGRHNAIQSKGMGLDQMEDNLVRRHSTQSAKCEELFVVCTAHKCSDTANCISTQ